MSDQINQPGQSLISMPCAVPAKIPTKVREYLDWASNGIERRGLKLYISPDRAPSDAQRQWLRNRMAEIESLFILATGPDVIAIMGRMTLGLATHGSDENETDARMAIYAEILAGNVSLWALKIASDRFLSGHCGDGCWLPKPAELMREAQEISAPWIAERGQIASVLSATVLPVPDQSQIDAASACIADAAKRRQEVVRKALEKFNSARSETGVLGPSAKSKPATKEQAQAWLDEQIKSPPEIILSDAAKNAYFRAQNGE